MIYGELGLFPIEIDIKLRMISYYIDRCELWGFIREIYSDISHVKYQFFPARTTFIHL